MPPRRRRRSLPARRSSSSATTWKKNVVKAEDSLRRLRSKVRTSKVPNALRGAAAVLAGAAASGALSGYGYDTIMGVDSDIALGLITVTLGITMAKPDAIYFGTGALTKAVADWTEIKIEEMTAVAA